MDGMSAAVAARSSPLDLNQSGLAGWFGGESERQQTLKSSIGCVGTGLHSGRAARLDLHPAAPDTGITFTRTDLVGLTPVPARYDRVEDTRLCTILGSGEARIGTIEHLMAALAGAGIDNCRVTLDGPELPILDGSAAEFLFLIDCAGVVAQSAPRRVLEILAPVRVEHGEAWAELRPHRAPGTPGLHLQLSIDFAAPAIGHQSFAMPLDRTHFARELAAARTFAQAAEVETLRRTGLALGGSLDNAIVVDGANVLNPGGLRMEHEFVRHKLLDAVGDLALAGYGLRGQFNGHCSGHTLNNALLRALFATKSAWRLTASTPSAWRAAA